MLWRPSQLKQSRAHSAVDPAAVAPAATESRKGPPQPAKEWQRVDRTETGWRLDCGGARGAADSGADAGSARMFFSMPPARPASKELNLHNFCGRFCGQKSRIAIFAHFLTAGALNSKLFDALLIRMDASVRNRKSIPRTFTPAKCEVGWAR